MIISWALVLRALLICMARITDMSIDTFRILLLVKGRRTAAMGLAFIEIMIYMAVLNNVMGGGRSLKFIELLGYCAGFALGNFTGSWLESRFLPNFVVLEANLPANDKSQKVIARLQAAGYGTTILNGQGRNGLRWIIKVVCDRKTVSSAAELLGDSTFIVVSDVRALIGGYFGVRPRR